MNALPARIDIHLIRILYLLLTERSVSRVALQLNLPQPTISTSLRRLRDLTGDPLLVRGTHGLVPTRHAERLLEPARRILSGTKELLAPQKPFVPQEDRRSFHIAAPDYLDSQFLPALVAAVHRASPSSRVTLHRLGAGTDYARLLADGGLDLVIGNWDDPPSHLRRSHLFQDPIACSMRADSPYARRTASDRMTIDDYLSLPHVAPAQMLPGYYGVVEAYLDRHGLRRNVVAESAYFSQIPCMVAHSDMVLTSGRRFLAFYERLLPLKTYTVPLQIPPMRFYQLWHERADTVHEQQWLRAQVAVLGREMSMQALQENLRDVHWPRPRRPAPLAAAA